MLAGLGGFLVVGNTGVVHICTGDPFLFPSIAAVAVGSTLLTGGKGSYFGTTAGALVLTLITSLLTTMQMPEFGATYSIRCDIAGHDLDLRRWRGFRE
jgi:ribose transport system permease protein